MKTFTDNAGRTWTIAVNITTILRVKGVLSINLVDVIEGKLVERFLSDPVLLCNVIFVLCQPEAEEKGICDEDFGLAMAGDAIDQATAGLLDELVDFSPSPKTRAYLRRVLKATQQAIDKAQDLIDAKLTKKLESGELDRIIEQAVQTAGDSSGSAPELSASTPDP